MLPVFFVCLSGVLCVLSRSLAVPCLARLPAPVFRATLQTSHNSQTRQTPNPLQTRSLTNVPRAAKSQTASRSSRSASSASSTKARTAARPTSSRTSAKTSASTSGKTASKTSSRPRSLPKTDLKAIAGSGGRIVYLAEKHSIARALADALPGRSENRGGYIQCGEALITWLSGHLLEQAPPEYYDARFKTWSRATLPIVPERFQLLERTDRGIPEQLKVIRALLDVCPVAVNAADFDREGQLLVDEVLELVHYRGRVLRLQTRALDPTSLVRELGRMRDNEEFAGLREAARARSQLDWLAGMNLTRAMTLHGRSQGASSVLSLGRVQTPTLALVVERDRAIENFVPKPFYKLSCPFAAEKGVLQTVLVLNEDMAGVDSEKRLMDKAEALRLKDLVSGRPGSVTLVENKRVQEAAPLPYSLTDLQKEASARFGLGAKDTLAACQRMYEAKFISYPRTDCPYLPEEQFKDAPAVLEAVSRFEGFFDMVQACDCQRRSAAWNTSKVSAHHGIIPTMVAASGLSDRETKVYTLICRRYAWQFLPPHIFHKTRAEVACEGTLWRANGRIEESAGWTAFKNAGPASAARRTKDEEQNKDVILPEVHKGEAVQAGEVRVDEAMTTPPARFTEGTLVDAMENIQRYLKGASADDQSILKKTEGLGTVATRAQIIETLFARGYLIKQGKAVCSTPLGRSLVDASPASIRDPLMTADMERSLSLIQEGRLNPGDYVAAYAATLPTIIEEIFAMQGGFAQVSAVSGPSGSPGSSSPSGPSDPSNPSGPSGPSDPDGPSGQNPQGAGGAGPVCPVCGRELARKRTRKGTWFWSCTGFPQCRYACDDVNGQPRMDPAPRPGRATGRAATLGAAPGPSSGQAPDLSSGQAGASGDAVCPRCGRPLVQRKGPRGLFWGCTGYPACRFTANDLSQVQGSAPAAGPETAARTDAAQGPTHAPAHGAAPLQEVAPDNLAPWQSAWQSARTKIAGLQDPVPGSEPALCPRCGKPLVQRTSARGPFWGCSGFPSCRFTVNALADLQTGSGTGSRSRHSAQGSPARSEAQGQAQCPRCGKALVQRNGSRGPFWGCSGFPNCRFTANSLDAVGTGSAQTAHAAHAGTDRQYRARPQGLFAAAPAFPASPGTPGSADVSGSRGPVPVRDAGAPGDPFADAGYDAGYEAWLDQQASEEGSRAQEPVDDPGDDFFAGWPEDLPPDDMTPDDLPPDVWDEGPDTSGNSRKA